MKKDEKFLCIFLNSSISLGPSLGFNGSISTEIVGLEIFETDKGPVSKSEESTTVPEVYKNLSTPSIAQRFPQDNGSDNFSMQIC